MLVWVQNWFEKRKCKSNNTKKEIRFYEFQISNWQDFHWIEDIYKMKVNKIKSAELTGYEQTADFQTTKGTADLKSTN